GRLPLRNSFTLLRARLILSPQLPASLPENTQSSLTGSFGYNYGYASRSLQESGTYVGPFAARWGNRRIQGGLEGVRDACSGTPGDFEADRDGGIGRSFNPNRRRQADGSRSGHSAFESRSGVVPDKGRTGSCGLRGSDETGLR